MASMNPTHHRAGTMLVLELDLRTLAAMTAHLESAQRAGTTARIAVEVAPGQQDEATVKVCAERATWSPVLGRPASLTVLPLYDVETPGRDE